MMIWMMATNDSNLMGGVEAFAKAVKTEDKKAAAYYGTDTGAFAKLKDDEQLIIFAHGNTDEIGDDEKRWTAEGLAKEVKDKLIPGNYAGEIVVSTCNSGTYGTGKRTSYIDDLLAAMGEDFEGKIFGYGGAVFEYGKNEKAELAGGNWPSSWIKIKAK